MGFCNISRSVLLPVMVALLAGLWACDDKKVMKHMPKQDPLKPVEWSGVKKVMGQKVYVPVYSSVRAPVKTKYVHMTATLSIHNISPVSAIVISKIDYHDINGKLIRRFIDEPFEMEPLATKEFVVEEKDVYGGSGASFIVDWQATQKASIPIIESVMISTAQGRGISMISRGKEIETF